MGAPATNFPGPATNFAGLGAVNNGIPANSSSGPSLFEPGFSHFGNYHNNYKKEYKEYLVRNFLCNQMSEYARLALGRTDLDTANINLPAFCMGQVHFLVHAILNNRITDRDTLLPRLFHFKNILEIVCNNSTMNEFNSRPWHLARTYDEKVVRDIDLGLLSWQTLGPRLHYDAHIHALSIVPAPKVNLPGNGNTFNSQGSQQKVICHDYNNKQNEGNHCSWSIANPGKMCWCTHVEV